MQGKNLLEEFLILVLHIFYHNMEPPTIQSRIYEIRGHRVVIDVDLAEPYQTETKILKQA